MRTIDDLIAATDSAIAEVTKIKLEAEALGLLERNQQLAGVRARMYGDAVLKYNALLRSALEIARRRGEGTNWDAFADELGRTLNEYHEVWLRAYNELVDDVRLSVS